MVPIDYVTAINFFSNQPRVQMPTLGELSFIFVDVNNNQIRITNSKGNQLLITKEHWNSVNERMLSLDLNIREMTSRYARGKKEYNWQTSPSRIFSPYVPAVMRYLRIKHNV